jgi:superoxide reductase
MKEFIQTGDWKGEKHAPVIEIKGTPKAGEPVTIEVSIGKEIPHPNTTAHHISWIEVYFLPEGEKFPQLIGKYEFSAHGAGLKGADTGGVYTEPIVVTTFKTEKPGKIYALSFCNIHGLWEGEAELKF